MATLLGPALEREDLIGERLPRFLRHCHECQQTTPHEVKTSAGLNVAVCVPCTERSLNYELDRD